MITLGISGRQHHCVEWGNPWSEVGLRRHPIEQSFCVLDASNPRASADNRTITDRRWSKAVHLHLGGKLHSEIDLPSPG